MKNKLLFIFVCFLNISFLKAQCTASFTYTVSAGTVSVSAIGSSGTTSLYGWQWGDGPTGVGTGQNTSHTYSADGTYSVCLTYISVLPPCTTQVCQNITITTVGLNEIAKHINKISISPNPATTSVNLDYSVTQFSKVSVSLFDVTGRIVDEIETNKAANIGDYSKYYNTEKLKSGLYFVTFKSDNSLETKKLIIE